MTIKDYKRATEELRAVRRELRNWRILKGVELPSDQSERLMDFIFHDRPTNKFDAMYASSMLSMAIAQAEEYTWTENPWRR